MPKDKPTRRNLFGLTPAIAESEAPEQIGLPEMLRRNLFGLTPAIGANSTRVPSQEELLLAPSAEQEIELSDDEEDPRLQELIRLRKEEEAEGYDEEYDTPESSAATPTRPRSPTPALPPQATPHTTVLPPTTAQSPDHVSRLLKNLYGSGLDDAALVRAQEAQDRAQLIAGLSRAGMSAGAALSRGTIRPEYAAAEALEKQAGQGVERIETRRKAKDQELVRQAAIQKVSKDNDLMDATSELSKSRRAVYRSALDQLGVKEIPGFENMSAYDLESSNNVFNLMAKAISKQEEKSDKEATKSATAREKDINTLSNQVVAGKFGELYMNAQSARKAKDAITEFSKDPTGYSDYATLMQSLKALQGDQSVVRETEIKLGMKAGSLMDTISNVIQRPLTGKSLTDKQRTAILSAVTVLHEKSSDQYLDGIHAKLTQARRKNIPLEEVMPLDMHQHLQEKEEREAAKKEMVGKKVKLPKQFKPDTVLQHKKFGKIRVGADGVTGTIEE